MLSAVQLRCCFLIHPVFFFSSKIGANAPNHGGRKGTPLGVSVLLTARSRRDSFRGEEAEAARSGTAAPGIQRAHAQTTSIPLVSAP